MPDEEEIESTEENEEIDDSSTLDKAVKGAAEVVDETFKGTKKEKDSTTEEEDEPEETDEEEDEEEEKDDLTDEQKAQAKNIFKLLSNPDTAVNALKTLASQAGLEFKEPETKKEEVKQKKAISAVIKDALGTNYPHLAEVLGTTLEGLLSEVIKEKIEEGTKDIMAKQNKFDHDNLVNSIKSAQNEIVSQYVDVPAKVLREFVRMQEEGEILPGPKQTPDKFFKAGITIAAENLGFTLVKRPAGTDPKPKTKVRSPLDEINAKSRSNSGSGKDGIKTSTQVKTFSDAIKLGVEAVEASMKK